MHSIKRAAGTCLILLLLVHSTGCTYWKAVPQPVPSAVSQHPSQRLRLHLVDGRRVVVDSARSVAEGLVGYQAGNPLQFPLAQVSSVRSQRFNAIGTLFVAILGGGVVFLMACPDGCIGY